MKVNIVSVMLLSVVLTGLTTDLFSQGAEWQPMIREIVVKHKDSTVRAHILIHKENIKTSDRLMYYWYNQDKINKNMGGYSGDLLQGEYLVFDNNDNLITQGNFDRGLKHGTWKRWNPDGILKLSAGYHYGLLDGEVKLFDAAGNLYSIKEYKAGEEQMKETGKLKIWKPGEEEAAGQDSTALTGSEE
ncbi:MAG: hypothetical protein PVF73_07055 [Bacteroidales bacterium]|jgi:hypothetical protein